MVWNTTTPRFNRCFQRTIPVWFPSLLLWLFAPIQICLIRRSSPIPKLIPYNLYNLTRLFSVIALVGVNATWLGYDLRFFLWPDLWRRISITDLTTTAMKVFSFTLLGLLLHLHRLYGVHTSGLVFIYLLKSVVLSLPVLYMYVAFYGDEEALSDEYLIGILFWDPMELALFSAHFALLLMVFLLSCFADRKENIMTDKKKKIKSSIEGMEMNGDAAEKLMDGEKTEEDNLVDCPEQRASYLSMITFWWFNGLTITGYKRALTMNDLWRLLPCYTTAVVAPKFDANWLKGKGYSEEEITRYLESNGGIGGSLDGCGRFENCSKPRSGTVGTIVRTFGWDFAVGVVLRLVHDLLSFVNPLLLKVFIGFVSSPDEPAWHGYVIAILFFLISMKQSFLINLYFHNVYSIGMKCRTALISAVYRKALSLSNGARRKTTTGEIINLMSVDAHRFESMIEYINLIWAFPLQLCLTMYFLYLELGASVFAGFAVMVAMVPLNVWISNVQQKMQVKQMQQKDERIKVLNEVLSGIRVIKLYGWEVPFIGRIGSIRNKEIFFLKWISYINAFSSIIWTFSPFLVSFVTFAVFVYFSEDGVLDAKKAFVSLSLFELLRYPLTYLPDMIAQTVLTSVSVKRLNRFFYLSQLEQYVTREHGGGNAVEIRNGTFAWEGTAQDDADKIEEKTQNIKQDSEKRLLNDQDGTEDSGKSNTMKIVTLNRISITIRKGSLVAIVGGVGSGKSSLLSAILGEMDRLDGSVNVDSCETLAYVAQQAWIRNATLRENILFGSPYVKSRYDSVVNWCALKPDLDILPGGDLIEIGEKGINLSGGQKQRVAIARAAYSDASLILMDDPLSAVDSHVAEHIFHKMISNDWGFLRKRTRVLVTNNVSFLPEFDQIIILNDGAVSEVGTYAQLIANNGRFSEFIAEHVRKDIKDEKEEEKRLHRTTNITSSTEDRSTIPRQSASSFVSSQRSIARDCDPHDFDFDKKLIDSEWTESGHIKWNVYIDYFRTLTPLWLFILLLGYVGMQIASVGSNFWLAVWSNDYSKAIIHNTTSQLQVEFHNTSEREKGANLMGYRLAVYGILGTVQGILFLIGALALVLGTVSSSIMLHTTLLDRIMRSPIQFFDTTPLGRIVNRFSKDIDTVDTIIPTTIDTWLICFLQAVSIFILICIQVPIFLTVILPILLLYFGIHKFYVSTSRQLKRLDSVTRSPIYSHFSETLTGAPTIRAYNLTQSFISQSNSLVDENQRCFYPSVVSNRWLSLRLEFCGNLIVFFAALFSVLNRTDFSDEPGFIGLILTYSMSATGVLNWCVRMTSAMESNIVAVERIAEYCGNRMEREWTRPENRDPKITKSWPHKGTVEFDGYSVRYREGLDLVLNKISLRVGSGEKIGIVGRTGAGKSSLTLALFRILEAAEGRILIDGVDINLIGLHELREKLSIIPQDPFLFSGTIRSNLDPFSCYTDSHLWQAVELCRLKEYISLQESGLDYPIDENGSNLSVGQRQLVCLGRALLRRTSILVLDEATAAIDLETDAFIQQTIKREFADCTVLTIAHRLNTIVDSDKVLVLEQGRVAEFAPPADLLADRKSKFYSLAKDARLV